MNINKNTENNEAWEHGIEGNGTEEEAEEVVEVGFIDDEAAPLLAMWATITTVLIALLVAIAICR